MSAPLFTVITATYNRSRWIMPTLASVLGQSIADFEYLVIGDAVTDDTGAVVAAMDDPRLRWINTPTRWRTQSGPNARGLAEARGRYIAYLGHDDIWAPDHLETLLACYRANPGATAVGSGLLQYLETEDRPVRSFGVTGPTGRSDLAFFVPPSGFSHGAGLPAGVAWRPREQVREAVDADFMRQLVDAGAEFAITGKVTAHKWSSATNYLSYLFPDASQQAAMLDLLRDPVAARAHVEDMLALDRAANWQPDAGLKPDIPAYLRAVDDNRGLAVAPARPLTAGGSETLAQDNLTRGRDWRLMTKDGDGFRWCGPSRDPRILVPFCHDGPAEIRLRARVLTARGMTCTRIELNHGEAAFRQEAPRAVGEMTEFDLVIDGALKPKGPSLLRLFFPTGTFVPASQTGRHGVAIAEMTVTARG